MKYRYLGSTGLSVSELCFGAMTFGEKGAFLGAPGRNWSEFGVVPEQTAYDLVYKALDAGINFFDTADCYKNGQGEELLGNALKGKRQQVIIGTKGRWQTDPNPNALGASRYHIINAVEASLQRLKTDYIDIYHLHGFDPRRENSLYRGLQLRGLAAGEGAGDLGAPWAGEILRLSGLLQYRRA